MQANGAPQEPDAEEPCRNGAQNGEASSAGTAHTNGLTVNNNGNAVVNVNNNQLPACNNSNSNSVPDGVSKKKRLSPGEEDVIRLVGQHLHDLGLK